MRKYPTIFPMAYNISGVIELVCKEFGIIEKNIIILELPSFDFYRDY
ncbi:MAG: hypothetical protein AABY32_01815 [Nanoarchaeota archaeon]|mgnify:CR=1 FL=1